MTSRYAYVSMAVAAVLIMILITLPDVEANDVSSNGVVMDTTLYLAGSSDDLKLWAEGPNSNSPIASKSATVDEQYSQGYVDVGTWESEPLDKDLHVEGEVSVILFINATDNDGPDVRFQIELFGETHVTEYYGTNTGISRVEISFSVTGWDGPADSRVTMYIQADAEDATVPSSQKDIHLHFFNLSVPSRIEFLSDATDIAMDTNVRSDNQGVRYYEIFVNITDAFEDTHIDVNSFILNITSVDDPDNYTAEVRLGYSVEYLVYRGSDYWGTLGYTSAKWHWYYEGREYSNNVEGQGVEPGDFWMNFKLNDTEGNKRFYNHLEVGVSPIHVHVNIHTDDEYITVVDSRGKDVNEVAAHDEVKVRVWIEINKGRRGHTYAFYVEFRDNGALVEGNSRQYVEMEGKAGKYIFFNWDPTQGSRELSIECDSDNEIAEIDESDNDVARIVEVITEARPNVIISHPTADEVINSDVYIIYDASNSTNPLSGEMSFDWTIYKMEDEEWTAKTNLDDARAVSTKLLERSYGAGKFKAEVRVENSKRVVYEEVIFYINTIPTIELYSPDAGVVYNAKEPITFDASDSEDEDGDKLFFWWFSEIDGVLNKEEGSTDYTLGIFERTLSGGTHNITLEVYDYDPADPPENGKQGMAVEYFSIIVNTPPRVEVIGPIDGFSYSSQAAISFDASRSEDPDDPEGESLSFTWTDGNTWISSEATFEKTLSAGPHTITVEVSDGYSESTLSINITVGSAPTAQTTSDTKKAKMDGSKAKVTLDASDSVPADDTVTIVKYYWDKDINVDSSGDNVTDNDIDYESTDPKVTLEYNNTGTYTAHLTVEDSAGIRSEPFAVQITIDKEDDDDDFPIAMVGGAIAIIALVAIGGFIFYQRMYLDDDDEYEDDEYYEGEYEEAEEYEAEYY